MSTLNSSSSDHHPPSDQYLVLELYHNPHEYNSMEGKVTVIRAVCPTLQDAAELIGERSIKDIQGILDDYNTNGTMKSYQENLFVVKVPVNTFVDTMNLPRIPLTESDLSETTRNQLKSVKQNYTEMPQDILRNPKNSSSDALYVNRDIYEKDRRAREYEMMQRRNIQPLWRGNITNNANSNASNRNRRRTVIPAGDGTIPQPAIPVQVRQAHPPFIQGDALKSVNFAPSAASPATFQSTPTPSTSAPIPVPGLVPVANEVPNPITTSVPLAPVVAGAAVRNTVTDSYGHTHETPPVNTGTSDTSRVTGI